MQPLHIAIIMDGNGRWAQSKGLPRADGHAVGAEKVKKITEYCSNIGLKQLTLYCFSSENWKRPKEEVEFLMQILSSYIVDQRPTLLKNNVKLAIIGRRTGIPQHILDEMDESVKLCSKNTGLVLCLAINYGARPEIVDAVQSIIREGIPAEQIDEQTISDHLYTAGMTDPDLLIRTAGEMRLSNYLLWQLSYSEIWVTQTLWPDFDDKTLDQAITEFKKRDRKFGGLK
ncbi:MAG: isoprenyl transferase [Thermoguttaceae bacterium]